MRMISLLLLCAGLLAKDPKLTDAQRLAIREAQIAYERAKVPYDSALARLNETLKAATPDGYRIDEVSGKLELVKAPKPAEKPAPK